MQEKVEFTKQEQAWLDENEEIAEEIEWVLDDAANVNPSEDGSFDNALLNEAINGAKLVMQLSNEKLLKGPYNTEMYNRICASHPVLISKKVPEPYFWQVFTFHCLNVKEEENVFTDEAIFLYSLQELISYLIEETEDDEVFVVGDNSIYNFDTGNTDEIDGIGLLAKVK
jgi:hypothetical protein